MNAIINNTTKSFIASEETVVLVEKFQTHARKTAESILEMGKIVFEAKKLADYEFSFFCISIGFDRSSPTIRKFEKIGEKYDLLISKSKSLPSSWTTIYDVAVLGNEVIEDYVNNGSINQATSAKELKTLLGKNKIVDEKATKPKDETKNDVPNRTPEGYSFITKFDDAPNPETVKKLRKILKELEALNVEIQLATSLEDFMPEYALRVA